MLTEIYENIRSLHPTEFGCLYTACNGMLYAFQISRELGVKINMKQAIDWSESSRLSIISYFFF